MEESEGREGEEKHFPICTFWTGFKHMDQWGGKALCCLSEENKLDESCFSFLPPEEETRQAG